VPWPFFSQATMGKISPAKPSTSMAVRWCIA